MSIPYEAKAATGLEHLGLKTAAQHLDQVAQRLAEEGFPAWLYTRLTLGE